MIALVEERSAGRIKVDLFPAAQLGSEVAMIEGVRMGSLDASVAHVANASTVVPELALFSVPYLFKDRDHYERVLDAARDASAHERRRNTELDAQAIERMKAKGAQIVIPERARFEARIAPIQEEVAKSLKMTGGIFTPTEAASVAAIYALFITMVVYRSLAWKQLPGLFSATVLQFSQVLFCVAGAAVFGWLLAFYRVPGFVTDLILGRTDDWRLVMLLIVALFLVLGTFMDALPAIFIFAPIVQPAAHAVGIHPVHLGVVVVMTLALGLLTPPYGLCALTACAVAGIPVTRILKLLVVMMTALVVVILLSALLPPIVLALPHLLAPAWL